MDGLDRITAYKMAQKALELIWKDETLDEWIALYANGVMDMVNPDLKREHCDIAYASDVSDLLDEMMSQYGGALIEDEVLNRAFDLICWKCVSIIQDTILEDEEYQGWYERTKKEVQGE